MDDHSINVRRQTRSVARRHARGIRLTERDRWLLDSVGKMRFATTRQLAQLLFGGSRSAANKRLRRLFDAGVIRTWVRDLASDNIYALTPAGRAALTDAGDASAVSYSCPRRLDGRLDHLLAINATRVTVATTLTDGVIAWWQSDWELRRFARRALVSDARFAVRWSDGAERVFALEVEHGTRAPRKFLGKILQYTAADWQLGGRSESITLVVVRRRAPLERYRSALAAATIAPGVWFTTLPELEQHGADAAIWRPTTGDRLLALRALTTLPYGSATEHGRNAAVAPGSDTAAAHIYPFPTANNVPE
jgi:hypothetical protein